MSKRTNGGGFDHVSDGESLDGLIFGCTSRAVGASDGFDVAAAFLVTSAEVRMLEVVLVLQEGLFAYLDARFLTMIVEEDLVTSVNYTEVKIFVGAWDDQEAIWCCFNCADKLQVAVSKMCGKCARKLCRESC